MDSQLVKITKASPAIKCIFCQKHELNDVEWGPMYQYQEIAVHYFCLLFSSAITQNGEDDEGILGFLKKDILKEVKRGAKLKCKYCPKSKATIGCVVKSCKYSFHYTCGYAKGTLHQFHGSFSSYCPTHKPEQIIPNDTEWNCPICYLQVKSKDEGILASCCGKSMFHRTCLMRTAKEAGYFFKCPLCNDSSEEFLLAMKENGVYVPEEDAAWEREPNAYAELTEQYSKCDARKCLCPGGRKQANKEWPIIRCSSCGSAGTHPRCTTHRKGLNSEEWKCHHCLRLFRGIKPSSNGNYTPRWMKSSSGPDSF